MNSDIMVLRVILFSMTFDPQAPQNQMFKRVHVTIFAVLFHSLSEVNNK
jgi:hypothetical protein